MGDLKYKVGDKVRVKSLDWYNENKDEGGDIECGDALMTTKKTQFCGKIVTISSISDVTDTYKIEEDNGRHIWTDEMIECKVEEETKPKFKVGDKVILDTHPCIVTDITWRDSLHGFVYTVRGFGFGKMVGERDLIFDTSEEEVDLNPKFGEYSDNEPLDILKTTIEFIKEIGGLPCPEGYVFKDENGNVINATKIVLEKKSDDKLKLESTKKVREYWSEYARIFIEIYDDEPNECIFTHLWVVDGQRQKGHGKQALIEAETIAKELGCHTSYLKVETNSWMHNWYLRCGYQWYKNADKGYTWLTKNL